MPQTPLAETEPARRAFLPQLTRTEIMVASAIVAVGLVLRLRLALITYLNPDEAAHALNSFTGWREMFIYSYQVDKHPPLLMYMTHVILFFSRSDLALRLIPIVSGCLFPIFMGLWLARVAGKFAGMTTLFLLTLTPHLVIVSAQLRTYTLAFLFLSASLVAFEIAMDTGRWPAMLAFDVLLLLSVCSDYSTAWFAGAVGIYALMRLRASPFAVKIAWAAGQLAPAVFYVALFFANVRHIPSSVRAENARSHWLFHDFPHSDNRLRFPVVNTAQQFNYVMASLPLGILAWAMFAGGIYFLWSGRTGIPRGNARPLAVLLMVPFLLGIIGAYAKVFPYGATRQSLVIGIFAAAGVAIFLEFVPRPSRTIIAGTAVVPILIWLLIPNADRLDIPPWRNRKSQMLACLSYIHATIPPDARIVADRETLQMLMYYEGSRAPLPPSNTFIELPLADRWRVGVREYEYATFGQFRAALAAFRAQFGIGASQPVWVLDGGFVVHTGPPDNKLPFTRAIRVFHTP
jgi:hypothetical protein